MGGAAPANDAQGDTQGRRGGHRLQNLTKFINTTNATVATIAIVVGWIAGAITLLHFHSSKALSTTVAIAYPSGDVVAPEITMKGTVHNLPSGKNLWVDIQDLGDLRHNPNNHACSVVKNEFECGQLFIGGLAQHNHEFQLQIWIVGLDQIQAINTYNSTAPKRHFPGMTSPPDGTVIATSIEVLR